jgi:hypothetical protein
MTASTPIDLAIVLPVYIEGETVEPVLRGLRKDLGRGVPTHDPTNNFKLRNWLPH